MSLLDLIKNIRLYLAEKINAYNFVNWGAITNLVPEGLAALLVVDWGFARLQEYLELESPYNEALYVARIGLDGAAFYSVFEVFRRVFIVLTLPTAHNLLEADWWRTTFNFREWHPRDYITFVSKLVSTFNISLIWTGIRRIIFQSISGTLRDRFNNPFTDGLARLIENPLFETPFMISAFALNAMIYPATIDTSMQRLINLIETRAFQQRRSKICESIEIFRLAMKLAYENTERGEKAPNWDMYFELLRVLLNEVVDGEAATNTPALPSDEMLETYLTKLNAITYDDSFYARILNYVSTHPNLLSEAARPKQRSALFYGAQQGAALASAIVSILGNTNIFLLGYVIAAMFYLSPVALPFSITAFIAMASLAFATAYEFGTVTFARCFGMESPINVLPTTTNIRLTLYSLTMLILSSMTLVYQSIVSGQSLLFNFFSGWYGFTVCALSAMQFATERYVMDPQLGQHLGIPESNRSRVTHETQIAYTADQLLMRAKFALPASTINQVVVEETNPPRVTLAEPPNQSPVPRFFWLQ